MLDPSCTKRTLLIYQTDFLPNYISVEFADTRDVYRDTHSYSTIVASGIDGISERL